MQGVKLPNKLSPTLVTGGVGANKKTKHQPGYKAEGDDGDSQNAPIAK
jgi:hypothetical protein